MTVARKNLISALLISLALFAFWALDVYSYKKITILKKAIQERRALISARTQVVDQISELYNEYQRRSTDVDQLSAGIPNSKSISELISAIDRISSGVGAQLDNIDISEPTEAEIKKTDLANKVPILLHGRSSYQSLLAFLENLEKNIRLIDVESLNIQGKEDKADVLDFTLRGTAYYLK